LAIARKGKITLELDYEIIPDENDIMLELSHPSLDGSMHCIYISMREVEDALIELAEWEDDGEPLPPQEDETQHKVYKSPSPVYFDTPRPTYNPAPPPTPAPVQTPRSNIPASHPTPDKRLRKDKSVENIQEMTEQGIGLVMGAMSIFELFIKKRRK
jgi:hypothetical protein